MTTQTKATHTPGPWRSDEGCQANLEGRTFPGVWGGPGDLLICIMDRGTHDNGTHAGRPATDDEIWANARLIAAAPDLLAALESCLLDLERYSATHGPGPDRRLVAARAAIDKARGE